MKNEYSAGFVVFINKLINDKQERLYLILHSVKGHWELPKGKIDPDETTMQAAMRELKEETSVDFEVIPGFEQKISYIFNDDQHAIYKEVTFFLAHAKSQEVVLSSEHLYFKWLPLDDAIETLSHLNSKEIVKSADQFIQNG